MRRSVGVMAPIIQSARMRVAIGADHAGFPLKEHSSRRSSALGHTVDDLGTDSEASVDYPPICMAVGRAVAEGGADRGIVLGGSGQGEQIAANKVPGVRAALCNDLFTARLSREHNDANVLSMGGRIVAFGLADEILDAVAEHAVRRRTPSATASIRSPKRNGTTRRPDRARTRRWQQKPPGIPMWRTLAETDPEIADAIRNEIERQNTGLELIASENFVSRAVLEAAGSVLTNKYAEGYPGQALLRRLRVRRRRRVARDRAREAAVRRRARQRAAALGRAGQHGGLHDACSSRATRVLGMNLAHGGHLTHGHPLNFSGKLYTIVPYGVRKDDERIDYDEIERLARRAQAEDDHRRRQRLPAGHRFRARFAPSADRVGALVMADMAHIAGLVAAGVHPSPVPHSDFVTTTTHKTLRGPRGGMVLCREQYAKDLDRSGVPRRAGRPADAHHRGQGGLLQGSARSRRSPSTSARSSPTPRAWPSGSARRRLPAGQRRHRQSPDARRRLLAGHHRQGRRGRARQGRHHGQQERDSVRSEPADGRRAASASARRPSRRAACAKPRWTSSAN